MEMPMTPEEVERECHDSLTGRKRVLELKRADNETGFAGIRRLPAASACHAGAKSGHESATKKRYHASDGSGAPSSHRRRPPCD